MINDRHPSPDWQSAIFFFGASFNPPTLAHISILKWLTTLTVSTWHAPDKQSTIGTHVLDTKIVAAPVFKHAFATTQENKATMPSFEHRKNMVEIALKHEASELGRNITVSDIEKVVFERLIGKAPSEKRDIPKKVGTIDILNQLYQNNPDALIIPVIGEDAFNDIQAGKWKNSADLIENTVILVLGRSADNAGTCQIHCPTGWGNRPAIDWQTTPHALPDISATAARNAQTTETMSAFLPKTAAPHLISYMRKNHLYQWQKAL